MMVVLFEQNVKFTQKRVNNIMFL